MFSKEGVCQAPSTVLFFSSAKGFSTTTMHFIVLLKAQGGGPFEFFQEIFDPRRSLPGGTLPGRVVPDFGQSNFGQPIWPANFGQSIFGQSVFGQSIFMLSLLCVVVCCCQCVVVAVLLSLCCCQCVVCCVLCVGCWCGCFGPSGSSLAPNPAADLPGPPCARPPQNVALFSLSPPQFGLSDCAPRGFTRQPENSKREHLRLQKHHRNSTRRHPQYKKSENGSGRGKKRAKFWAPQTSGPPIGA